MEIPWWKSKLVWLGILQTLVAVLLSLSEFLSNGAFTPSDVALFVAGVLTIVIRIWFSENKPVARRWW